MFLTPFFAAQPSSSRPYPFAPNAITRKRIEVMDPQIPAPRKSGRTTRGIMAAVHAQLRSQYDPDGSLTALFARKSFDTVPAGSVLIVETWNDASRTTFSTFAGALIAIRRRHTSTSFVLRNIVNRTGVEVRFNLYSPLIKDIKVVQRAVGNKKDGQLRRARRAKLYFVRHDDNRLPNVSRSIQVMRAREEREREALRRAEERSKAAATGTGQPGQQAKAGKS